MTHRLDIGVDCDGVLSDFVGGTIAAIERSHGRRIPRETFTRFDFLEELNDEAMAKHVRDYAWKRPGFCRGLAVLEGAREGVEALKQLGHVRIVTAPLEGNETWSHERVEWLAHHVGIAKRDVIFCDRKELVDVDVLIDDRAENIHAWAARRWFRQGTDQTALGILWDTTTNRKDDPAPFLRVTSWAQAIELVKAAADRRAA